jgi:hypothetical protein
VEATLKEHEKAEFHKGNGKKHINHEKTYDSHQDDCLKKYCFAQSLFW